MNLNTNFQKTTKQLKLKLQNKNEDLIQVNQILFQLLNYPNIEQAQEHHRASNLGTNDLLTRQAELQDLIKLQRANNLEVCACCGLMIDNDPLPYCTRLKQINLGVGVHLFFRNYLYTSFVFLLMFCIFSIYALTTNLRSYEIQNGQFSLMCQLDDSSQECGFSVIGAGSKVLNQTQSSNKMSKYQSWIAIGFVSLWGLINIFKTHRQQKFIVDMDEKRISASDFTLMITHFPGQFLRYESDEEKLENIQKVFKSYERITNSQYSYQVIKINIARSLYPDKKINQKNKKEVTSDRHKKQDIFRQWIQHRKKYTQFPDSEKQRKQIIKEYQDYILTHYHQNMNYEVPLQNQNIIFVTLKSSKAREEIQAKNRPASWKNLWHICRKPDFPIDGVTIRRAPEPQEIRWMNVGFPKGTQISRKVGLWIFTFLLIGASIGISIGIAFINEDKISQYVSIGISLVVTIINIGIQMLIMISSTVQNEFISSVEQSNIAIKIGIGQVINSIFVPIIVTLFSNKNHKIQDKSWLKAGGLVDDVFYIALFNLAVPFGRLIDPWEIFLKLKRWWYRTPSKRLNICGQKEFNKLYGNYEFDIGYQYAYLIKTSIFTSFFTPMQPIISIMAPLGLLLYYFFDKRNLLRHFQRPTYHSSEINSAVQFILLFSPLAFGFGSLLVNNFISEELENQDNGTLLFNWIIVIVGGCFLVVVPLKIFYYCCIKKPVVEQLDFDEKKAILKSDYDRMNPVTKQVAIATFQQYLKKIREDQKQCNDKRLVNLAKLNAIQKGKIRKLQQAENARGSQQNLSQHKNLIKF